MYLRRLLPLLPFVLLLKVTGCADNTNPTGPQVPPNEGEGEREPQPGGELGGPEMPKAPVSKDLCKVTKPGDAGKVIKSTLLLPEAPLEGELFIDKDGVIACADKDCSKAPDYAKATKIECHDTVLSPGLINPHDHISFAHVKPHAPMEERYEHRHDWRKGARDHTKIPTGGDKTPNAVETAELRFAMSGVTAIAGAGGTPGMVRNVDSGPALLESGLRMKAADSDTFPLDDGDSTAFPTTCDGFKSAKRTRATEIAGLKGYLPHIAEGIDASAHAEFVCQSGGLEDAPAPAYDLVSRQTAVVHGMAVNPDDVERYRDGGAILVWSPRSNIDLYGNTAPIALYDNLGVPIALGTDWLPSGSMNMSRELRCADELNDKYFGKALSDKQLWQAVTINSAFAVGGGHALGMLKAGYLGDVAIFDATGKKNPYRAVIEAGVEDTVLVLRGGKALYGDTLIASEEGAGGGADCEELNVCNVIKKACVKPDSAGKKSLADLQAAADKIYPLFFCKGKVPTDEPSCAPARPANAKLQNVSTYDGIKEGDKDGDGILDAADNCPTVFNPIRPMDNGKQGDADGDKIGDACDKCPLEAGEACTQPESADSDGDGIPNAVDNCPDDPNKDQVDADGDGKGAVCDLDALGKACDSRANAGHVPCPTELTITQLRRLNDPAHPRSGDTRAILTGVYVTAVKTVGGGGFGFFVQAGTAQYSGIFVSTGTTAPTVKVGNRVDLEGDYEEKNDLSQLSNATVKVVDPATELPFEPVRITSTIYGSTNKAAGEPWEGMLCRFDGPLAVSVVNADAKEGVTPVDDFDEFAVGLTNLRVDDFIYNDLDNNFAIGTSFNEIIGIYGFSFSNRKIWPRDAADITPNE